MDCVCVCVCVCVHSGYVLAHAFPPGTGRGGDVHFDDDEPWTTTLDGTNLLSVAAHEIGHALGVSHSDQRGALMYAWYDSYNPKRTLHTDDIAAIQHLYGRSAQPLHLYYRLRFLTFFGAP